MQFQLRNIYHYVKKLAINNNFASKLLAKFYFKFFNEFTSFLSHYPIVVFLNYYSGSIPFLSSILYDLAKILKNLTII